CGDQQVRRGGGVRSHRHAPADGRRDGPGPGPGRGLPAPLAPGRRRAHLGERRVRADRPVPARPGRTLMSAAVTVLAFSLLTEDARVLKQVRLLAQDYRVTTVGYGPAP